MKELTSEQRAAAVRLKRLWQRACSIRAAQGERLTQEAAADALGWTQGAVGHYLNGRTPLGPAALLKWSVFLGVSPLDIYPELAADMGIKQLLSVNDQTGEYNAREEAELLAIYRQLSGSQRSAVMSLLQQMRTTVAG